MEFLKKLLGGHNEISEVEASGGIPWINLTSVEQLEKIKYNSEAKTQLIFKHSTRCGVSRMVMRQFEESYGFSKDDFDVYFLDLLGYRDVSNAIASLFQVVHQSPQLVVVKNGVVADHASHGAILDVDLNNFI